MYSQCIDRYLRVALLFTFLLPTACLAWSGKVVSVTDGDSIVVLHNGKKEKINLYGIDAPEMKQNFGKDAREFLRSFVAGEQVEIERKGTDKHGRTLALVSIGDEGFNEFMVVNGFARVHRKSCKEKFCSDWIKMEDAAKEMQKGMWIPTVGTELKK